MSSDIKPILSALSKPFGQEDIKQKRAGNQGTFDYVSHGTTTEFLNRHAPDWSTRVIETYTGMHTFPATTKTYNGQTKQVPESSRMVCHGVIMEMTIAGVTRVETGGPGQILPTGTFAFDLKNAYSDALKRCAMRFGVALSIWENTVDAIEDEDYADPGPVQPTFTPGVPHPQPERDNPKGPTQAIVDRIAAAGRALPGNTTRAADEERVWLTWDTVNPRVARRDDLVDPQQLAAIMQLRTALGWSREYIRDHVIPDAIGTGEIKQVRNLTQHEARQVIEFMIQARDLIAPKDRPEWRPADWDKAPAQGQQALVGVTQ